MAHHYMDHPPTRIGSRFARTGVRQPRAATVIPLVVISVNEVEVGTYELDTLKRFSKVAAALFLNPLAMPESTSNSTVLSTTSTTEDGTKTLNLKDARFSPHPTTQAISFILEWMNTAKATTGNNRLPACAVSSPETTDLSRLCDVYAAALLLDTKPWPKVAQGHLKAAVTHLKPTLAIIRIVHERLPLHDAVMTRTITSFFEHGERREYQDEEVTAIKEYVMGTGDDLCDRFGEVEDHRTALGLGRGRRSGRDGRDGRGGGGRHGGR